MARVLEFCTALRQLVIIILYTNSDGADPRGRLVLSGNTLYGTAASGGTSGNGTIFAINTDGTDFTTLHSFTSLTPDSDTNSSAFATATNTDGVSPAAALTLSSNTLYGTAGAEGSWVAASYSVFGYYRN